VCGGGVWGDKWVNECLRSVGFASHLVAERGQTGV